MSNQRHVKVFLASSITELKEERQVLSEIGADISHLFSYDEIWVEIVKCENFHAGNLGDDDQIYIDQKLRDCNISLFVFKSKVGKWTRHEYDVARRLQQEKKHRIFVCFLPDPDKKKDPSLKDFQKQLERDKVFWKDCATTGEVKHEISMGILTHLGITVGGSSAEAEAAAKNADERFEQFEQGEAQQQQRRQQLHQDIDDLLAQIPAVLADESQLISARIVEVMGLYQKASRWATKTDYDKEKYSELQYEYAQFLYKYGMYYDAEAIWLRQIPLAEDLYGKKHEKTANSYNEIGLVYWKQGNYPKALEYYRKALAIDEKILGKDHPDTATTYDNIGSVYHDQGKYAKALEYYGKALAIDEKVLGKDHPDTATTYACIGLVYHDQGKYPEALEYYGKSLAIKEKILDKDHPDTAATYNNIGLAYDEQGDYPQALKYYWKALEIDEKVLGKAHPETAYNYHNIGTVYYQQEKYSEALEYLEKALKIRKEKLGKDHPYTKSTQEWIDATKLTMD